MKDWRPQLDLARLSAALAEEILVATEDDVGAASAASGHAVSRAAQDVRALIDALNSELGEGELEPLLIKGAMLRAPCARQH
jgi:hypothetical protein